MHRLFGKSPDNKCKTCSNLYKYTHSRSYYKCDVWGYSASISSDWRCGYVACGMYNKEYTGNKIKDYVKHSKKPKTEEQIEGQIKLDI